jgi:hypothetical protein
VIVSPIPICEKTVSPRAPCSRLSVFPSAQQITVVQGIAIPAGEAANEDQLQDEPLEGCLPSMTVYLKTTAPRALTKAGPGFPHFRHIWSGCIGRQHRRSVSSFSESGSSDGRRSTAIHGCSNGYSARPLEVCSGGITPLQ